MTRLLLTTSAGLTVPAELIASVAVPLATVKSSGLPEIVNVGGVPLAGPVPEKVRAFKTKVPESLLETTEALATWLPKNTSEFEEELTGVDGAQLVPADQFVVPLAEV